MLSLALLKHQLWLLREKFEKAKLEQEILEAEIAERKRIQREAAIEEERLWYEQHGKDYADYEDEEEYEDEE
ncbi:hypothetical protein [Nostoc commune]|uniref:hypothetical protein n=1 Tax=Nostoc commune TaxID=1178 RepID=UPI0018C5F5C9|nr:hypothetical protein [Nostoc commune]